MSHKANHWLAEIPAEKIKSGAFRVLFHLCDAHNSKRDPKTACFPSQASLMEVTGLSNGGLNNALNAIEEAGLMRRRQTKKPNGTKGPTYYILECDFDISTNPTPENGDGANSSFEAQPTPVLRPSHLHSTGDKPVIEPLKEPVNAHKRENDLFSDQNSDVNNSLSKSEKDEISEGFEEFWEKVWPSHKRKAQKVACGKKYRAACEGKHGQAERQVTPDEMNAAAKRYIASVQDREYLKAPLAWLNGALWEPFLGSVGVASQNGGQKTSPRETTSASGYDYGHEVYR